MGKHKEPTTLEILTALNRDRKNRLKGVVTLGASEILSLLEDREHIHDYINAKSNRIRHAAENEKARKS